MLNRRSPALSETPGLMHVIPAGTFQPCQPDDHLHRQEFSFVENVIREFCEEVLGEECLSGDHALLADSVAGMYSAGSRDVRNRLVEDDVGELLFLGTVIDPLNLKPEILTVLMLHSAYVAGKVRGSWETDSATGAGMSYHRFNRAEIERVIREEPFVPTGKALLRCVLKHFDFLVERLGKL